MQKITKTYSFMRKRGSSAQLRDQVFSPSNPLMTNIKIAETSVPHPMKSFLLHSNLMMTLTT